MRNRISDVNVIAETRLRALPLAPARRIDSPWDRDEALLNLSLWWVKMTRPDGFDFTAEVAAVFAQLRRDLR